MSSKMNRLYTSIILFAISFLCVYAQSFHTTDAVTEFRKGRTMYLNGNYAGCMDIMRSLLRRDDAGSLYEEAAFYTAMSQARSGSDRTDIVLSNYLREYPFTMHRHEIDLALGHYYYRSGRYSQALDCYTKIDIDNVQTDEQDDILYHMAYCYTQVNDNEKALPLFKSLVQNSSQYRNEARYYEGYIYYQNNDYDQAYRCLSVVRSNSEYGYEARYLLANIDFFKKDYAQAIARSEQLLAGNADTTHVVELHRILGESHYQLNNDDKAREYLAQYIQCTPNPSRTTLYMSGMIAYRSSDYLKAIELLSHAADTTDAMGQNACLHLGLSYLQQKELHRAAFAFEQAALSKHDDMIREIALYNRALCCYESNLSVFDSSISVFKQFLSEYPQSVYADDVNTRLSELYLHSRNYTAAIDYIDRIKNPSREILEQRQQVLYMIGTEEFANNSISSAGEWFTKAIKAGNYAPEYRARSIYWLGECCYRNRAYKEALKCYNQFLSAPITTDETIIALAHYNVAYCHFKMRDYNRAIESFKLFARQEGIATALLTDANNRMGDCLFQAKEYAEAEKYYAQAALAQCAGSDYALLQQAVISGINKQNSQKIASLKQLVKQYPQSEYSEEAYNEMGTTYIAMNKPVYAIETYKLLLQKYPHGISARKAMLQLGAIYYNQNDMENSITSYRTLIEQHPASSEAKIAAEDLKSVYIEMNRIDELSAFMKKHGISYEKNELDSLTYLAAERSYMKQGKTTPLEDYVTQYPKGNYAANAYFYLGNVADAQQNETDALSYYQQSLQVNPDGEFAEDALIRCSSILYDRQEYEQAATAYTRLETTASTVEVRQSARMGALRCYVQLQQYDKTIDCANRLLSNSNLSPEIKQETLYCRATAYSACKDDETAYNDFVVLATDTRSIYGAESAFRVAEHLFMKNKIDEAEKAANDFINKGTTHTYWLARNFILLSDIYVCKGDYFTAHQYLVQLQENYRHDDDITTLIAERLQKLSAQQSQLQ